MNFKNVSKYFKTDIIFFMVIKNLIEIDNRPFILNNSLKILGTNKRDFWFLTCYISLIVYTIFENLPRQINQTYLMLNVKKHFKKRIYLLLFLQYHLL